MQANSRAATAGRNQQLDGLRGYAALVVVVFHTILGIDPGQINRILYEDLSKIDGLYGRFTKVALKLFSGETAVVIFFVLSGAVLFNSLLNNKERFIPLAGEFLIRRFLRIYPALFVCLVACAIVFPLAGIPVTLDSFFAQRCALRDHDQRSDMDFECRVHCRSLSPARIPRLSPRRRLGSLRGLHRLGDSLRSSLAETLHGLLQAVLDLLRARRPHSHESV
jgi:hypothetical protein